MFVHNFILVSPFLREVRFCRDPKGMEVMPTFLYHLRTLADARHADGALRQRACLGHNDPNAKLGLIANS